MLNLTNVLLAVDLPIVIGVGVGALLVGAGLMLFIPFVKNHIIKSKAKKLIRDAEIRADHIIKNAQIDGKQAVNELKQEASKEFREKKVELQTFERSLQQREQGINRRDGVLLNKETIVDEKNETLNRRLKDVDRKEKLLQEKIDSIIAELEKVAQMSTQQAREDLFARVESKVSREIAAFTKAKEEEAEEEVDQKAKELLGLALTRFSQDIAIEKTVSVVALPNDEMKGRIIGREGRNIRSLEQLLGVDLIIDDTPEVITVSCFNPIRREIARLSLEALIKDGRIQPGRIEEIVERTKKEVAEGITKTGQEVAFKLGLPRINKELLNYVGRLKYRTSYGQNALDHALEVAYLSGVMAAELGLNQNLAKRAGLLHDIGKAADFEMDGSHVELGSRLAKK